ncbi:MAG: ATPase, T2SS/T4P/T4SS family [Pseudomonadota bacterium]
MNKLNQVINRSARDNVSDLHIMAGQPLVFRKNGMLFKDIDTVWSRSELEALLKELLCPRDRDIFDQRMSVDFAVTLSNIRIRINVFQSMAGHGLAIRILPGSAPTLDQLNLHPCLKDYCRCRDGLILICGSTGAGKSGTIAAMIEEINRTSAARIVTLEDPVEYRFVSRKSFITQRELGIHFPTFEQGLLDVLREDADVIVVGELRNPQTMRLALDAAESGHLVITTAHASSSEDALYRISNSFPAEAQTLVRNQLASTLVMLIVQKLVLLPARNFRVPILSILKGTQSVKGIIRDDKLTQLESALQTGRQLGMFTQDNYMEYMAARQDLTPPSMVFVPSMETSQAASSSANIRIRVTEEPPGSARFMKRSYQAPPLKETKNQRRTGTTDQATHYVIEEEVSMEELIQQMSRSRDK